MKIHQVLTKAVESACKEILENKQHAAYVITQTLAKDKRWGARDRRFMAETCLYVVKNYRLLCHLSNQDFDKKVNFESVVACAIYLENNELPDYYSKIIQQEDVTQLLAKVKDVKTKYSFPDWIDELLSKDLTPKKWKLEAEHSNNTANTYLRVNTSKSNVQQCLENLSEKGIEASALEQIPNCLVLTKRADIRQTEAYKNGWLEIQDAGSQMIGSFLDPKPREKIIDACAGAGGKSLHLADLMQNKGKISAMDIEKKKLKELETRTLRNGFEIIKTHLHQKITLNNYKDWADKLLLDVPCSGLGVLKRNPDDKWKLTPERLEELMHTQSEILQNYSQMLRTNGILVYSTCSIYSGENQKQIKAFIKNNPNFELLEEKQLYPSDGYDGFYMAKLIKK